MEAKNRKVVEVKAKASRVAKAAKGVTSKVGYLQNATFKNVLR